MLSHLQPNQKYGLNDTLTSNIINKCVNFTSYEINKENVKLLYKNQVNKYIIEITKEDRKPILINCEKHTINKENENLYTEICKKIEKINLTIENYEDILDIIYDLNLYINKIMAKKSSGSYKRHDGFNPIQIKNGLVVRIGKDSKVRQVLGKYGEYKGSKAQ